MKPSHCMNPEIGNLISHYEMGVLDESDRDRFEEHLLECDFCAQEVESMYAASTALLANREAVRKGLEEDGISFEALRRRLAARQPEPRAEGMLKIVWERLMNLRQSLRQPAFRWATVGATTGLVLIVAAVYLVTVPPSSRMSGRYVPFLSFQALPYEGSMTLRGEGAIPGKEDFDKGMEAYLQADYPRAARLIQRAVGKSPDRAEWWLYLGVCGYLQHDPAKALKALERADELSQGAVKIRARWFLTQACLLKGDHARAEPMLEWIILQNKDYSKDAFQLLSRLRQEESTGETGQKMPSVLSPSGGEVFLAGSSIAISWQDEQPEDVQHYQIWLSMDGGVTFPKLLAAGLPSSETEWQWSNADIVSGRLSIQITAVGQNAMVRGSGSKPFAVVAPPLILVQSPGRGDHWRFGVAHDVNWTLSGTSPLTLSLELYRLNPPDTEWVGTLAAGLPGAARHWLWRDSLNEFATTDPGDHFRVKVVGSFTDGQVESWNAGEFSVASTASVTVNLTAGEGGSWAEGDDVPISWESSQEDVRSYSVELGTFGSPEGKTLVSDLPGSATEWMWANAGPPGTFFIRVIAHFLEGDVAGAAPLHLTPRLAGAGTRNHHNLDQARSPDGLPQTIDLQQNYPNPFNATTTINFDLSQSGSVRLSVYNMLGQKISTLVDGSLEKGRHTVQFNAGQLASGVYLYRLEAAGQVVQKQMLLTK